VPKWPTFNLETRPTMIFGDTVRVEDDPRRKQLEMIEAAPYVPNAV